MAIIVQKYGGKSVATVELIRQIARRIIQNKKKDEQIVVVISAMGNRTDEIITKANQITSQPDPREMDLLLSTGEQESIVIMALALQSEGHPAISLTGQQAGIHTDNRHLFARIKRIYPKRILNELDKGKIVVVAGFQGSTAHGEISTLGRGGSDLTAVALAASLKADICEKYTDESGVFTANPKLVPDARKIDIISYDEMIEMSSLGAKVLQSRSVLFAKKHNVNIRVRSSINDNEGTLITKEVKNMEEAVVTYVIPNKTEAKITILGVPDKPGIAATVFGKLAEQEISVDMILQNISEAGKTDITFTVDRSNLKPAIKYAEEIKEIIGAKEIKPDDKISKISVVGVGMRSTPGVAAIMFKALADNNINIEMISTSEIRISCVIREERLDDAVRILHDTFQLGKRQGA